MNESLVLSQLEGNFDTQVPQDSEQDNIDDSIIENIELFNSTDPNPIDFSDNEVVPLDLEVEHDNPDDGYGGRVEPENVQINLVVGDVIDFSYSENLYSGVVAKVSKDNRLVIRHLDAKKFREFHLYDQNILETPPN